MPLDTPSGRSRRRTARRALVSGVALALTIALAPGLDAAAAPRTPDGGAPVTVAFEPSSALLVGEHIEQALASAQLGLPSAREQIAATCPVVVDDDLLRNGADAGLCERSVLEARSDTAARAIVAGFGRLGLPYSRGRRMSDHYDDCSSFVGTSYRLAGFPLSDSDWEPSSSVMRNASWAEVVDEPQPGDILWRRGHVAMALADGYQMHAAQSGDVTHVRKVGRYSRVLAVTTSS